MLLPATDWPLSGRLLPQADSVHSMPEGLFRVRQLLPQTDSVHSLPEGLLRMRQLLPQTFPGLLLACHT